MSAHPLRYRSYRWHGGVEWLAEIGSVPPILIVPPLFEELNRCRALLIGIMRALAGSGYHAVLPDLPGTGESPRELASVDWSDWIGALGMISFDLKARSRTPLVASFRGGGLLDEQVETIGNWRFAPAEGKAIARDLVRARQATMLGKPGSNMIADSARLEVTEFAGYAVPPDIYANLSEARLVPADVMRTVRLDTDSADAELKLVGKPLWRQSEPGNDPELATRLAADIVQWHRACAG